MRLLGTSYDAPPGNNLTSLAGKGEKDWHLGFLLAVTGHGSEAALKTYALAKGVDAAGYTRWVLEPASAWSADAKRNP